MIIFRLVFIHAVSLKLRSAPACFS